MSLKTLIISQTAGATSDSFFVSKKEPATIHCVADLVSAETVAIEISLDDETFIPYQDGAAVQLTASINALRLYGPAFYRVVKSATATATAVQKLD